MEKQNKILMAAAGLPAGKAGIILVAIVLALVFFFTYYGKQQEQRREEPQTQTAPAKEEILQALSAPSKNALPVSEKDKRDILNALGAPAK